MLEKDMYGYAMVRTIRDLGYEVEGNTLYPLLRRLEKNGWVKSKWDVSEDRPRKFYGITDAGRGLRTELLDNSFLDGACQADVSYPDSCVTGGHPAAQGFLSDVVCEPSTT
jgi:DNA-binding PadR family transcriptional regulator